MLQPKEHWKVIPEFPGYEIHINGMVRHTEDVRTIRPFIGPEAPFLRVNLFKGGGKTEEVAVLPLVRELFTQEERDSVNRTW